MCYGIMYDSGSGMRIVGPEDVKSGKCKNRYSEARSFLDGLPVLDPE